MRGAVLLGALLRQRGVLEASLLTLLAGLPLLRGEYLESLDGLFHLYRLAGLDRAFHQGVFYPRWFPDFAYGYGHPVLNYYSPLAYYIGEIFHLLGAGYILATKLTFFFGFLLAGLAIYFLARDFLGPFPALVAAVAYTYAPYHLADVYVRGALAESFAFVFMPLALWAIHRLSTPRKSTYGLLAAFAYAGLILSHNLTALIFAHLFLAYCGLEAWSERRWGPLIWSGLSFLLALGLTAFYWLPALAEARWVGLAAGMASPGYRNHLAPLDGFISPFFLYRYFPEQGVRAEYPLSLVQGGVLTLSLIALFRLFKKGQREVARQMTFFSSFALLSLFMTLTYSLPLWMLLERPLASLQYPWRFMNLASLGQAFMAGGLLLWMGKEWKGKKAVVYGGGSLLILFLALSSMGHLPLGRLEMGEKDVTVAQMWENDFAHRQIGATWTAEYLPVWVRADRSEISLPPSTPKAVEASGFEAPKVAVIKGGYLWYELGVKGTKNTTLRFHIFYFPGWQGYVDGKEAATYPSGEFGLVTVGVPAGEHQLVLRFEGTKERKLGNTLSLASLIVLILVSLKYGSKRYLVGASLVIFLLGGLLAWHLRPFDFVTQPIQLEANLEGKVRLLGYHVDKSTYRRGEAAEVTLYWLALEEMRQDYKVFVHLMDEGQTKMWAQHDDDPVWGFTPTTRWLPGEVIEDRHTILIPPEMPAGAYRLFTGMYDYETLRNLTITDPGLASPDNRIELCALEVR